MRRGGEGFRLPVGARPEDIMRSKLLCTAAFLALMAGSGLAHAQAPQSPRNEPSQQEQAEKALQTPSGKSGAEEPGSHAPTTTPRPDAVFVNGALAVPGAPENSDTVPAKFSRKNAADDELITMAYAFKSLPDDQRQAIYQALKDEPAVENVHAEIGTEMPASIELRALPDHVTSQVPQTRGYQFAVSDHRVLLVAPANRIVVAVFPGAHDLTTGGGERVR